VGGRPAGVRPGRGPLGFPSSMPVMCGPILDHISHLRADGHWCAGGHLFRSITLKPDDVSGLSNGDKPSVGTASSARADRARRPGTGTQFVLDSSCFPVSVPSLGPRFRSLTVARAAGPARRRPRPRGTGATGGRAAGPHCAGHDEGSLPGEPPGPSRGAAAVSCGEPVGFGRGCPSLRCPSRRGRRASGPAHGKHRRLLPRRVDRHTPHALAPGGREEGCSRHKTI
jgi:hypothetical protein